MDLHTLHLSSAITNVTCCIVLAVAWFVRREKTYIGWWSAAFLVFASGLLLQITDETHSLVAALTYALLVGGSLLMLAGFRSFDGRAAFSRLMLASLPLPPTAYLLTFAASPGTQWPELATFVLSCLITIQVPFYVLVRNRDRLMFRWVAGIAFTTQLIVTVSVIVWGSAIITPENVTLAISLTDQVCSTIVIACVLGMVIERDNRRLDRLVHRDPLTGCLNRAGLASVEQTTTRPQAVLLADLDHFKRLNDKHGHGAGDEALREFVRRTEQTLPNPSLLARYGGEEFVILLPGASELEAHAVASHVKNAVNCRPFEHEGEAIALTVSIGVAMISGNETVLEGIRRADDALYEAKRGGRNRIVVHGAPVYAPDMSVPVNVAPAAA